MSKNKTEYSRSSAPFVFFIILSLVFIILALLTYPNPFALIYGGIALFAIFPLPATLAINKEWEEAIIPDSANSKDSLGQDSSSNGP
jgi:hypothetical protein